MGFKLAKFQLSLALLEFMDFKLVTLLANPKFGGFLASPLLRVQKEKDPRGGFLDPGFLMFRNHMFSGTSITKNQSIDLGILGTSAHAA